MSSDRGGDPGPRDSANNGAVRNVDNHQLLAQLEDSFKQGPAANAQDSSTTSNPLLARLNQNSAERAQVAAVGNQLGPEGTRVPAVIGDFVGLNHAGWNKGVASNGSSSNHDYEGDEDDTLALEEDLYAEGHVPGMDETMRAEALSAASAVDPNQLLDTTEEGASLPWNVAGGFETGMQDDDDELDENDPALEELGLALTPKTRREKKKSNKRGTVVLTPEVQALLGQANYAYVSKDYKTAVDVFQQVIVKNPSVFQAWNSMGLIQEELGNIEKALQLFMVAAHLTPKDGALWKKLAVISKQRGYDQQALYCFSRAYRADKDDMDALWDRSIMYQILDQPYKAIQGFQKLLKVKHHYMPALEELVKLYSSLDQDTRRYRENMHQAMLDYEAAYLHYSSLPDRYSNTDADPFHMTERNDEESGQSEPFGYSALNMLSELYIMFEEYEKPITVIKAWSRRLQRRSHQTWWDDYKDDREFDTDPDDDELQASLGENRTRGLPVDLRVKLGICRLMMEEVKEAKAQFKYLWRCSVEDFPDLYEEIAELYVSKQMWKEGFNVIRAMMQFDEMDVPKTWVMAGECLRHMNQMKEAKDYLEQAHRDDPSSVDVSMMLAEVHEEMGNLPQALSLVNYVRRVNEEKQAEAEKRRREAKIARDAKANRDGASSKNANDANLLDPSHSKDYKFRQIAPRPSAGTSAALSSDATRGAMERIKAASRDRAAAERYASADRDRDIQLLRSAREQERADKLADRESHTQELRDVIDKFNRLDVIYQRIDQKEKSRVWESKHEAVKATREDRTQYIQGARELINVFRSNGAFYPREKNKPYLGTETRKWRYRRYAADLDSGLSEHASAMSERLGRLMGVSQPKSMLEESLLDHGLTAPPTTYKEVSFDAWYLLMIRQAVYLTFEDRYAEAAELLMKDMYNANVFYSIPRRRSGIMLVALACAMWAADFQEVIKSGRRLCNFGGLRPLAVRLYQSIFTRGPRGNLKFFAWVQGITHKYLKREIIGMRHAIGKGAQQSMRKVRTTVRKKRQGPSTRAPRKSFAALTPTLASPRKKVRLEATAKPDPNPQQMSEDESALSSLHSTAAATGSATKAMAIPLTGPERAEAASARLLAAAAAKEAEEAEEQAQGTQHRVSFAETKDNDGNDSNDGNDGKDQQHEMDPRTQSEAGPTDRRGSIPATPLRRKRRARDEGASSAAEEQGEGDQQEEFDDEDDDYDVHDELYKEDDDEDKELDPEEYDETEWEQDDPDFRGLRKGYGKAHSSSHPHDEDEDEDEDDDEDGHDLSQGRKRRPRATARGDGERRESGSRTSVKFTRPVFPKFQVSMVMFMGHVLAHSRSHIGAAAQFAECMEYAPTNPMIQLYLGVQFLNVAMQRTTPNRQMAVAQGLVFIQNYYRLRMAGFGSLALAERDKANMAQGRLPTPSPIAPLLPIVGVKDGPSESQNATEHGVSSAADASEDNTVAEAGIREAASAASAAATAAAATALNTEEPLAGNQPLGETPSSEEPESPLTQCQQEAEYNFARALHQLGQYHLAMIHYKRVLELPSWREVERQQQMIRKQQEDMEREVRKKQRSEARALANQRRLERKQQVREIREAKRQEREEAKAARLKAKAEAKVQSATTAAEKDGQDGDGERVMEQDGDNEEEAEDEDEDDMDMEEDDDDGDDDNELEDDESDVPPTGVEGDSDFARTDEDHLTRIRLQGVIDDDPTDLKREAAFNLAKIYALSGAMGQAQLVMRKYCTL
ncbi:transcription factor TFIIIC subunit tfc4 [Mortierella alpina]|uniref:Transcription factor TFIIIC subunit tfc4 n=1 Tax=Mortierella alpina TaxID=64518 RepID=A0A9P6J990_MORAP|nr:transcription factor TFIIIC subunit tfc4 [Mortierella alpina]